MGDSSVPDYEIKFDACMENINNLTEEMGDDTKVVVSVKFIRDTESYDVNKNVIWLRETFDSTVTTVYYICDICDKEYLTPEELGSIKCENCGKYYDYCKEHGYVSKCPFCLYCDDDKT